MSERDFYLSPTGNMYRLMRDSYYGDGGYRGAYLIPHKRETEQNYRDRQQTAYYLNHFSLIVNALVNPIFKRRPLRDWTGTASPVAEAFLEDVDGAGNDMDSFMQAAALSAKLYGAVFIVVENFQAMDLPASMGEALAQRKFPYAYTLDPDRVEGVSIDKNGRVLSIKFRDTAVTSTMGDDKERTVYFDTTAGPLTRAEDCEGVMIHASAGLLNATRVRLDHGVARVRFYPLGYTGEIKIKLGRKWYEVWNEYNLILGASK